jgi:hypothetical protein
LESSMDNSVPQNGIYFAIIFSYNQNEIWNAQVMQKITVIHSLFPHILSHYEFWIETIYLNLNVICFQYSCAKVFM